MKNPIKVFLSVTLVLSLCLNVCTSSVQAMGNLKPRNRVGGEKTVSFETQIVFTEEQGRLYREAMERDIREHIEALTNELMMTENVHKETYLLELIEALEKTDVVKEVFDNQNCTSITLSNIPIGLAADEAISMTRIGTPVTLQNDTAESLINRAKQDGRYDVVVTDTAVTVRNQMTFEEFASGSYKMSEAMDSVEGQGVKTFPMVDPVKNPNYTWGKNACQSVLICSMSEFPNIVHCNKCDRSENESYNAAQWAVRNSDCAKSVRLGVYALNSPVLFCFYYNSVNCVIEALESEDKEKKDNVYCNRKVKIGPHFNCSWFTGIGHTESFHIHD